MAREYEKHGHSNGRKLSPTYLSWALMIQRCYNPKATGYARYGGRGITVCARWHTSFLNFLADMGERPAKHTLDRKNNDGNYNKGNCRWATTSKQGQNSSRARLTAAQVWRARALCNAGWSNADVARLFGVARSTIGHLRCYRSWKQTGE